MIETKIDSFAEFLEGYRRHKSHLREIEIADAKRFQVEFFNIFYLLGLSRAEVRTHSNFLANLLNPNGNHGQGMLFLRSFLDMLKKKYKGFPYPSDNLELGHWSAFTEKVTRQGRLDIVVMNPIQSYVCLIENKIDALEGHRQLERYSLWLNSIRDDYHFQAMVYLTIHGEQAISALGYPFFTLSYRRDIASWLSKSIPEIQAASVKEIVRQYIDVIRRL